MCKQCEEETCEEIALKNGAAAWKYRADALAVCRAHGLIEVPRPKKFQSIGDCSMCDCEITPWMERYCMTGAFLCMACASKSAPLSPEWVLRDEAASTIIFEQESQFGSILDWVPLYHCETDDAGDSYVLVCANTRSRMFGRFALSTNDSHGRSGFATCSVGTTLESILADCANVGTTEWNDPIRKLMYSKNLPIEYG
jgi:hypothetical protein